MSNLILSHINWTAMVRAIMDGTVETETADILDPSRCELGRWLENRASKEISDPAKLSGLKKVHSDIHRLVTRLV